MQGFFGSNATPDINRSPDLSNERSNDLTSIPTVARSKGTFKFSANCIENQGIPFESTLKVWERQSKTYSRNMLLQLRSTAATYRSGQVISTVSKDKVTAMDKKKQTAEALKAEEETKKNPKEVMKEKKKKEGVPDGTPSKKKEKKEGAPEDTPSKKKEKEKEKYRERKQEKERKTKESEDQEKAKKEKERKEGNETDSKPDLSLGWIRKAAADATARAIARRTPVTEGGSSASSIDSGAPFPPMPPMPAGEPIIAGPPTPTGAPPSPTPAPPGPPTPTTGAMAVPENVDTGITLEVQIPDTGTPTGLISREMLKRGLQKQPKTLKTDVEK